jgi:hypothetical protein
VPLELDFVAAGLVDADLLAVGEQLDAHAVGLGRCRVEDGNVRLMDRMPSISSLSSLTRSVTVPRLPLSRPVNTMTWSPLRILFMACPVFEA